MVTVVKIGIVGSVIVFPVGIVILTYHLYCGRHTKEKGMSLQYPCIASFNMSIISHLQLCNYLSYDLKKILKKLSFEY